MRMPVAVQHQTGDFLNYFNGVAESSCTAACFGYKQNGACRAFGQWQSTVRSRPKLFTGACESDPPCVSLVGRYRYQEVGNDVTPKWAIYKFSEFTHLVSQLDHPCGRLGLCSPYEFGRPLGIRKVMAVSAPMQTRPQAAALIAYAFGEFQPGVLEVSLTTRSHFPFKVNRVHDILSGCGRSRPIASG